MTALLAVVALAFSAAPADRFDGDRAFRVLEHQVRMGPRPSGSPAARELAAWLKARLPRGRYDDHGPVRNVVGHLAGRRPAIVVAAHYDTKDMPGFVGAEDGAGGTAAVLEIARALTRMKRPERAREIRFVLFDGEECADDSRPFYDCGLRGSRPYASRHAKDIKAMVLLDFVAQKDLAIRREASSDTKLWAKLRDAARAVGSGWAFPRGTQGTVLDDHTPFQRLGVPAIDLIDFDFPCWHQTCDDLSAVSQRSLNASGEAVLELVRRLR